MRLIAHRGFGDMYPENSVRAVREASRHADMVEIDVRRCGSGELVVTHNAIVDIGVGGVDRVDERTAADLAASNAHDGEGIATLATVLEAIPATVGVNIELKEAAVIDDALAAARTIPNEVIISSFDADALEATRAAAPDIALAYILDATPEDDIDHALSLECAFVHPHESLCLLTDVVNDAHDADMAVNAWTVDSQFMARALEARGVDGVIADSPDVC
jgi:glycerophosphoryl diester phosphodiesterase